MRLRGNVFPRTSPDEATEQNIRTLVGATIPEIREVARKVAANTSVELYLTTAKEVHATIAVDSRYHSFRWSVSTSTYPASADSAPVAITAGTPVDVDTETTLALGEYGYVTVQFFTDSLGTKNASTLVKKRIANGTAAAASTFRYVQDIGGTLTTADVYGRITDVNNLGGTLSVWVNHDSDDSPDPTDPPDGTLSIVSTPYDFGPTDDFTVASGTHFLLDGIKKRPGKTKTVYVQFENSEGVETAQVPCVLHDTLEDLIDEVGELRANSITNAQQLSTNLRPYLVVADNAERDAITDQVLGDNVYVMDPPAAFTWNGGFWAPASAVFASFPAITAGAIKAEFIDAGAIQAVHMSADSISTPSLQAGAVTGVKISVANLAEIQEDAGILVAGKLEGNTTGNYLDLNATGTDPFLYTNDLTITAAGDATFAGDLNAATGTFHGDITGASGTFSGSLSAVGGTFGTITAGLLNNGVTGNYIDLGATGTQTFLHAGSFRVLANGDTSIVGTSTGGTLSGAAMVIDLDTGSGHVAVLDHNAFKLYADGDAEFSGDLSSTSINLTGLSVNLGPGVDVGTMEAVGGTGSFDDLATIKISAGDSSFDVSSIEIVGSVGASPATPPGVYLSPWLYVTDIDCTDINASGIVCDNLDVNQIEVSTILYGGLLVTLGVSNSGGAGFRLMRVPN